MKRKLALLLALSLVLSLIPAGVVFAEENGDDNGYGYEDDNGLDNDEDADENGDEDADADEDADENGDEDQDDDADENGDEDEDEDADENGDEDEDADENGDEDQDDDDYIDFTPISTDLPATTLRFVIGEVAFTNNGVAYTLDAAPYIDAAVGRTMVPLAAISEGLGAVVGWDGEARNVSIVRDDINLTLNVDTELPGGMGMPAIVEGRTFVPVAYVSSMLGATVTWDADAQAVYVVD